MQNFRADLNCCSFVIIYGSFSQQTDPGDVTFSAVSGKFCRWSSRCCAVMCPLKNRTRQLENSGWSIRRNMTLYSSNWTDDTSVNYYMYMYVMTATLMYLTSSLIASCISLLGLCMTV